MFCSKCGNRLPDGAPYCPSCGNQTGINVVRNNKTMLAAALFAFFLGSLGIHNFYLGYTGKGTAQLLLSTVGWIFLVGPLISSIWAFIEAIMIVTGAINTDAQGNPLV